MQKLLSTAQFDPGTSHATASVLPLDHCELQWSSAQHSGLNVNDQTVKFTITSQRQNQVRVWKSLATRDTKFGLLANVPTNE